MLVMLLFTVFVESANKWELAILQQTVNDLIFFSVAATTSPVYKTKVSAERIVTNVACFDDVQ